MLGIIALVVGIGSLVWSIIAWSIERRDRRADVAEERRLREATAARDRDRFAPEQGDREARGRTEVTAHFWGFRPVAGGRRSSTASPTWVPQPRARSSIGLRLKTGRPSLIARIREPCGSTKN